MFWSNEFLMKIRAEWLRRINKIQYQADGIWHDAVITDKSIGGNVIKVTSVTTDSSALTIGSVRIIDIDGEVAGQIKENITKNETQGVLTLWEFPLYEIEDKETKIHA